MGFQCAGRGDDRSATLWRAGNTLGGSNEDASYLFWLSGYAPLGDEFRSFDDVPRRVEACIGEGSFTDPTGHGKSRYCAGQCTGQPISVPEYLLRIASSPKQECPTNEGGKITYDAEVELFAADIVLSQPTGPTVSAVSGGLAEDPTVSGTSDVAFHATDPGSGVYEAIVEADGKVVEHEVINEEGGRCHDVGGTTDGLPAFLYTQPCPAEASADIPFDTTALTNGEHHLVVSVTDAAGNAATVLDREITVANQLPTSPRRVRHERRGERPEREPKPGSNRGLEGPQGRPPARPLRPRAHDRRDAHRPREHERQSARQRRNKRSQGGRESNPQRAAGSLRAARIQGRAHAP